MEIDDELKQLMKDLGVAINDSLANSKEIADAIQRLKDAGYNVFLILEATIGFNRRSDDTAPSETIDDSAPKSNIRLRVTAQDLKFLKLAKISAEDLESS